jgi:hypothetical protein
VTAAGGAGAPSKLIGVLHTAVIEPVRDEFWPSRRNDAFDEHCRRAD